MNGTVNNMHGLARIEISCLVIIIAIICVVAVPRYNRFVKTAKAKSYIHQLNEATQAALKEYKFTPGEKRTPENLPSDEELIQTLKKHLGGSIPENPFTKSKNITLQHHRSIGPCDALDATGGWVWNLVPIRENTSTVISKVWLNSDTVNISDGQGESCIQP
jgi:type II secretory pathway pseudopilin PulG